MNKIAIVGSPGSGKSTLSRRLGDILHLEVYHLDVLHWKADWVPTSREEKIKVQSELVKRERWIIDGNYNSTLKIRLDVADTIVFLDINRLTCLYRIVSRFFKYRHAQRPDMAKGNREKLDLKFLKFVWQYPKNNKKDMMDYLSAYAADEGKKIYILKNNKAIKHFLKEECQS